VYDLELSSEKLKMPKKLLFATLAVALVGCASAPKLANVIPQPGGMYQVTGLAESKEIALKSALYSAEQTCKPLGKRHVVTAQQTAYKGIVSEGANQVVSAAASLVSAMTMSIVPTLETDEDYQVALTFQCEA
jgi:hypothetical protein